MGIFPFNFAIYTTVVKHRHPAHHSTFMATPAPLAVSLTPAEEEEEEEEEVRRPDLCLPSTRGWSRPRPHLPAEGPVSVRRRRGRRTIEPDISQ